MLKKSIIQTLIIAVIIGSLSVFGQNPDRGITVKTSSNRLALIIGNSNYKDKADFLPNPVNDAKAIEQTLKSLGFEVILGIDADKAKMKNLIREFGDKLARTKAIGLVFYAGHGIAVDGTNYLIPTDADIPNEDEVDDEAIPIKFLLDKLELAGNPLNMLFLDACRNNPFARKWRTLRSKSAVGGLTKIDTQGTMIFYATEYGKTADDGTYSNSPFTKSLIKNLALPNVEFERMFRYVINDVIAETKGQQKPWKEGAYAGEDFYFKLTESVGQVTPTPTPRPTPGKENTLNNVKFIEGEATINLKKDKSYTIGEGQYEIITRWSGCGVDCVFAYSDYNGGVAKTEKTEFASINDVTTFDRSSRVREIGKGEILIVKNGEDYYAMIKVIDIDYEREMLAFKYKIIPEKIQTSTWKLNPNLYISKSKKGRVTFNYDDNSGKFLIGDGDYEFQIYWSNAPIKEARIYKDYFAALGAVKNNAVINNSNDAAKFLTPKERTLDMKIGDRAVIKNYNGYLAIITVIDTETSGYYSKIDKVVFDYEILSK